MNSRWSIAWILAAACTSEAWGQQAWMHNQIDGYWATSLQWTADDGSSSAGNTILGDQVHRVLDGTVADFGPEPPPLYSFNGWTVPGSAKVTQNLYAFSWPLLNHAQLVQDNFTPSLITTPGTCPQPLGYLCPVGPVPGQTSAATFVHANAETAWTDYYTIGGGSGAGQLTQSYRIHFVMGASPSATLPGDGSLTWELQDGNGKALVGFLTYYYADGLGPPSWDNYVLDRATGTFVYSGSEPAGVDPRVIDRTLQVNVPFTYGTTFGLTSDLSLESFGNTNVDASNTVELTSVVLPGGARFFADSGAAYGAITQFDGNAGAICGNLACTLAPVPEPDRMSLMVAGLICLGIAGWKRTRSLRRRTKLLQL